MELTSFFKINDRPIPVPDGDMEMSFEDLDSSESGRDETGFMHRFVVRQKVGVWNFAYHRLSAEAYAYILSLLEGGTFAFTYPTRPDGSGTATCTAYCSGYTLGWHSATENAYRNLKFTIIAC